MFLSCYAMHKDGPYRTGYISTPPTSGARPSQKLRRHHYNFAGTAGTPAALVAAASTFAAPLAAALSSAFSRLMVRGLRSGGKLRWIPNRIKALSHLFGGRALVKIDVCRLLVGVNVLQKNILHPPGSLRYSPDSPRAFWRRVAASESLSRNYDGGLVVFFDL